LENEVVVSVNSLIGQIDNNFYGSRSGMGSQLYAPTYHVIAEMMDRDKQDNNIYNPKTGYFINPFSISIPDAIKNGQIQMDGHSVHGTYTYVLNENGDVVFAKRFNPNSSKSRAPHPNLIGGKDPQVQCAGMIRIEKGRIVWYNNNSGHFRPNAKSLEKVNNAMEKLKRIHPEIFAKNYKGGDSR
jgi:hypothetical protein